MDWDKGGHLFDLPSEMSDFLVELFGLCFVGQSLRWRWVGVGYVVVAVVARQRRGRGGCRHRRLAESLGDLL